jgi:hypothetical protein
MRVDLLLRFYATQRFVASDVMQVKERSYCNRRRINQFLPLAIEIFGYLHKHVDVFTQLCQCHLELERPKGFHISILVIFFCQNVLITLQKMQAYSILGRAIAIGLTTS